MKRRQSGRSGNRCILGGPTADANSGCSNTAKDGFSLYALPTEPTTVRNAWVRYIKSTRQFNARDYSKVYLCSGHFTSDQFDDHQLSMYKRGFRKNPPQLKPLAVPKNHLKVAVNPVCVTSEFFEFCPNMSTSSTTTTSSISTSTSVSTTSMVSALPTGCVVSSLAATYEDKMPVNMQFTPTSTSAFKSEPKRRSAYEHRKEVTDIIQQYDQQKADKEMLVLDMETQTFQTDNDKATQASNVMVSRHVQASVRMFSCGVRVVPKSFVSSKGTQTCMLDKPGPSLGSELVHAATQTAATSKDVSGSAAAPSDEQTLDPVPGIGDDEEPEEPEDVEREEANDPTWTPSDDEEEMSNSSDEMCSDSQDIPEYDNLQEEPKYIVFESKLAELLRQCPDCKAPCNVQKYQPKSFGSQVKLVATCKVCMFEKVWHSQPKIGRLFAGNILLSAGILFAGASPSQVLKVLQHINVSAISNSAFLDHQKCYLQPAVIRVWEEQQNALFANLRQKGEGLTLGGDGRADSPGHSAKYGSYTLMDLKTSKILDTQIVQVKETPEVANSNVMELHGFKRSLSSLLDAGLKVDRIVTDRHPQIMKCFREKYPDIDHRFDVWHIAKGVKKNVKAVSKLKGCEDAQLWERSIVNHVYWVAASTPDGNPDIMVTKFRSIVNHIQNVHEGHGHPAYDKCAHAEVLDPPRLWLRPDTKVFDKLSEIVLKTRLSNDVKKMSPGEQTSSLEAYHSVLLYFCPKLLSFSYQGMKCRSYVSALHWNENAQRRQATKMDGTPCFRINYPKQKAGGFTVSQVLSSPTYDYVKQLVSEVIQLAKVGDKTAREQMQELQAPQPMCASVERPNKAAAVAQYQKHRRFSTPSSSAMRVQTTASSPTANDENPPV